MTLSRIFGKNKILSGSKCPEHNMRVSVKTRFAISEGILSLYVDGKGKTRERVDETGQRKQWSFSSVWSRVI